MPRRLALVLFTCLLLMSAATLAAPRQEDSPLWLIPPGQEGVVVQLLTPYFEAATVPRIASVQLERSVVRAKLELGSAAPVTLELQHADDGGLLPAGMPPGARLLASQVGSDLRIVALDAGPRDAVRDATIQQVADQILQNRMHMATSLWAPNRREEMRAKELIQLAKQPQTTRPLGHRGGLTSNERTTVSRAAVIAGLLGGLVLGLYRRRGGQVRLSK